MRMSSQESSEIWRRVDVVPEDWGCCSVSSGFSSGIKGVSTVDLGSKKAMKNLNSKMAGTRLRELSHSWSCRQRCWTKVGSVLSNHFLGGKCSRLLYCSLVILRLMRLLRSHSWEKRLMRVAESPSRRRSWISMMKAEKCLWGLSLSITLTMDGIWKLMRSEGVTKVAPKARAPTMLGWGAAGLDR